VRLRIGIMGLLAVSLVSAAAAQSRLEVKDLQNHAFNVEFPSGSHLRMHLQSGDFRIVGRDDNRILVHFAGKNSENARNLTVRLEQLSDGGDLRVFGGPKNELQVTVEIPRSTDLYVRMRGGDLDVKSVLGNKNIKLVGGDLTIHAGSPDDYAQVNASVRFGDVYAPAFGEPKGWIGGSIKEKGSGKYTLTAHVFAGDLRLDTSASKEEN
jgi:hypothetical protein